MSKSLEDLIPVILVKTKEKRIPWKMETDEVFSASLGPDKTLVVYEADFATHVSLRGPTSVELESVSTSGSFLSAEKIRNIYSLARRQALGVDKVLDDVEKTLLDL